VGNGLLDRIVLSRHFDYFLSGAQLQPAHEQQRSRTPRAAVIARSSSIDHAILEPRGVVHVTAGQ